MLANSVYFGVAVSVFSYLTGVFLQKKFKSPILNPLLVAIVLTAAVLLVSGISYETYSVGAKYLGFLLTPATVSLAVLLYEKIELLKRNAVAIIAGIMSGVITTLVTVLALSLLFGLSHEEYVTFLPKSITTAIGIGISEKFGGYVPITSAVIIITGVLGNTVAPTVCRIFKINDPIAVGVAIGTSSHAAGTAKAIELGEVEGAISSLSIVISGLLTVIGASLFANLI